MVIFRSSVVLGILLLSCTSGHAQLLDKNGRFDFSQSIQISENRPHDDQDHADLFLYRTNQFYGWGTDFIFKVGDEECRLRINSYFHFKLPSGTYELPFDENITLDLQPGGAYYVEAKVTGYARMRLKYRLVDDAEGNTALNKSKLIKCPKK